LDFVGFCGPAPLKRYLIVTVLSRLLSLLQQGGDAVLISVHAARGSVPREVGAWMAVLPEATLGSIGGGRLEWDAIAHARTLLAPASGGPGPASPMAPSAPALRRYLLGPNLGQCCGGEVHLQYERLGPGHVAALRQRLQKAQAPVVLFGAGHVGHALVRLLQTLDWPMIWVDSRDSIFPTDLPETVQCEHSEPVQGAVAQLPANSRVLVMSFSHAEDLDIVAACLARQRQQADLPFIGLIGSKTKWATFRSRLRARGYSEAELDHITCPIGLAGIADKRPEAIAIAVAAQLLLLQERP